MIGTSPPRPVESHRWYYTPSSSCDAPRTYRATFVASSNNYLPSLELDDDTVPPIQTAVKAKARDGLEALIPYTGRHLARTERMVQDSHVLDFLIVEMDGGVVVDEGGMDIDT